MLKEHQIVKKSLKDGANGIWSRVAGDGSSGNGLSQLNHPQGIFVDLKETLYVADNNNDRIMIFDLKEPSSSGWVAPMYLTNSAISLIKPISVVLDVDGNMYVVDNDAHRIVVIAHNLEQARCIIGCWSGPGSHASELRKPVDMNFDLIGNIYVTDSENRRVQNFSLETNGCGK